MAKRFSQWVQQINNQRMTEKTIERIIIVKT